MTLFQQLHIYQLRNRCVARGGVDLFPQAMIPGFISHLPKFSAIAEKGLCQKKTFASIVIF